MKEKPLNHTNRFLSYQAKQALIYGIYQAQKTKTDKVTLKFIFYGLIKANPSLLNKVIKTLFKKSGRFSDNIKTLRYRCERSFKTSTNTDNLSTSSSKLTLTKPVRNLLYSSIRSAKTSTNSKYNTSNYLVITTFSIFINLLKNKSFKNWLKDEIFLIKN